MLDSIKPPGAPVGVLAPNGRLNNAELLFNGELKGAECFDSYNGELYTGMYGGYVGKVVGNKIVPVTKFGKDCGKLNGCVRCFYHSYLINGNLQMEFGTQINADDLWD